MPGNDRLLTLHAGYRDNGPIVERPKRALYNKIGEL